MQSNSNLKSQYEIANNLEIKKAKFMSSTIFQDQKMLKDILGIFKIYGPVDAISWFSKVKKFCVDNYSSPNEIISYFHILLDIEFHKW